MKKFLLQQFVNSLLEEVITDNDQRETAKQDINSSMVDKLGTEWAFIPLASLSSTVGLMVITTVLNKYGVTPDKVARHVLGLANEVGLDEAALKVLKAVEAGKEFSIGLIKSTYESFGINFDTGMEKIKDGVSSGFSFASKITSKGLKKTTDGMKHISEKLKKSDETDPEI